MAPVKRPIGLFFGKFSHSAENFFRATKPLFFLMRRSAWSVCFQVEIFAREQVRAGRIDVRLCYVCRQLFIADVMMSNSSLHVWQATIISFLISAFSNEWSTSWPGRIRVNGFVCDVFWRCVARENHCARGTCVVLQCFHKML
jgi:hypothetical protein